MNTMNPEQRDINVSPAFYDVWVDALLKLEVALPPWKDFVLYDAIGVCHDPCVMMDLSHRARVRVTDGSVAGDVMAEAAKSLGVSLYDLNNDSAYMLPCGALHRAAVGTV
jgi:hypothetical protein